MWKIAYTYYICPLCVYATFINETPGVVCLLCTNRSLYDIEVLQERFKSTGHVIIQPMICFSLFIQCTTSVVKKNAVNYIF